MSFYCCTWQMNFCWSHYPLQIRYYIHTHQKLMEVFWAHCGFYQIHLQNRSQNDQYTSITHDIQCLTQRRGDGYSWLRFDSQPVEIAPHLWNEGHGPAGIQAQDAWSKHLDVQYSGNRYTNVWLEFWERGGSGDFPWRCHLQRWCPGLKDRGHRRQRVDLATSSKLTTKRSIVFHEGNKGNSGIQLVYLLFNR